MTFIWFSRWPSCASTWPSCCSAAILSSAFFSDDDRSCIVSSNSYKRCCMSSRNNTRSRTSANHRYYYLVFRWNVSTNLSLNSRLVIKLNWTKVVHFIKNVYGKTVNKFLYSIRLKKKSSDNTKQLYIIINNHLTLLQSYVIIWVGIEVRLERERERESETERERECETETERERERERDWNARWYLRRECPIYRLCSVAGQQSLAARCCYSLSQTRLLCWEPRGVDSSLEYRPQVPGVTIIQFTCCNYTRVRIYNAQMNTATEPFSYS